MARLPRRPGPGTGLGTGPGTGTGTGPGTAPSTPRAVLAYNAARLALFVVAAGLLYLAGLRGAALLFAALLVSGVLSWFLLTRQRVRMGEAVERSVTRTRTRIAQRTAAEDAYVDRMQGGEPATRAPGPDGPAA